MKKLLLLSLLSLFFFSCSDDKEKAYWEIYIVNIESLTCTDKSIKESDPLKVYEDVDESKMMDAVETMNYLYKKQFDEGMIDCIPIVSYRRI